MALFKKRKVKEDPAIDQDEEESEPGMASADLSHSGVRLDEEVQGEDKGYLYGEDDPGDMIRVSLPEKHHMNIKWYDVVNDGDMKPENVTLKEKAMLTGRVGLMMLSVGTGAWRVLDSMNRIADSIGITCTANIGLVSLDYTCLEDDEAVSFSFALPTTGVNTDKLDSMERFVADFCLTGSNNTMKEIHDELDEIDHKKGNYNPFILGLASGSACFAFTFLLGGGPVEMVCAFIGAFFGNFLKSLTVRKHLTLLVTTALSVFVSCVITIAAYKTAEHFFGASSLHESGYICAMLFIIPGFPLITGGLDLFKSHMRSGIERLTYAFMIIVIATVTGWMTAQMLGFRPNDLYTYTMAPLLVMFLRMLFSFIGVFGFSLMFNSPVKVASIAGCIGLVSNTLRLELVDYTPIVPACCALIGAFIAGMLAALMVKLTRHPRIAFSVPSIVIMVPGLYMYRAMYNIGINMTGEGLSWLLRALMIILALPTGLAIARIVTDHRFRVVN